MIPKWQYLVVSLEGDAVKFIDGEEAPYETNHTNDSSDQSGIEIKTYTTKWLDFLTNMGNAGFELIGEHGGSMIFKRPVT